MSTPVEQSRQYDRIANRNKIRRQHERHLQDTKIKRNVLKVLFLTLFLIAFAAVSVSESVLDNHATNQNIPDSHVKVL